MGWKSTGADADAIHDNVAGEIDAITEVTPVAGDWLLGEDTSDGDNKKKFDASNFLGGGGGALTLIELKVASGATASFDFTGIAASYEHLRIILMGRSDNASNADAVNLRFNNDSGANYKKQRMQATTTTVSGGGSTGQTETVVGAISAANETAGKAGQIEMMIPSYARTVFFKTVFGAGVFEDDTYFIGVRGGLWADTSAITRVTLFPAAGNFITGSVASLYGLD